MLHNKEEIIARASASSLWHRHQQQTFIGISA
jgi:hypothetical protein